MSQQLSPVQHLQRAFWRPWLGKTALVRRGAALPTSLKGERLARVLSHLLAEARAPRWELFATNLGLGDDLRVRVPAWAGPPYLFGTPALLYGEEPTLRLCASLLPSCSAFVDIGSHLGYFVWYLRNLLGPQRPGLAVEPHPRLFRLLAENLEANGFGSVKAVHAAVGDRVGTAALHVDETELSMSTLGEGRAASHEYSAVTVPTTTAAALLEAADFSQTLLKVDIEGAEELFVAGLAGAECRVRYLVMEVLPAALASGLVEAACRRLNAHAAHLEGWHLRLEPPWAGGPHDRNWLFFRDAASDIAAPLRAAGFTTSGR